MQKKKTLPLAILLVFVMTFLLSIGQIFLKKGANILVFDILALLTNYNLIIGLIIYAFSAFITIYALKYGEVSVLSPVLSLSYIWVALLANLFFAEPLGTFKIIGIFVIFLGVSFVGIGGK